MAFAKVTLRTKKGQSRLAIILSAFIFALHPIHTEAVAGIVGRADILCAIFFLLALLAFKEHLKRQSKAIKPKFCEKWYLGLTVAFATCAMFSKEQGITVLGVCCVTTLAKNFKKNGLFQRPTVTFVYLLGAIIGLLTLRGQLMGFNPPQFAKADNPASASDSIIVRALTLAFLPAFNVWLMVCPSELSFDWSMDAIPLIKSWSDPRNVLSMAFYAGLFLLAFRSRKVREQKPMEFLMYKNYSWKKDDMAK